MEKADPDAVWLVTNIISHYDCGVMLYSENFIFQAYCITEYFLIIWTPWFEFDAIKIEKIGTVSSGG